MRHREITGRDETGRVRRAPKLFALIVAIVLIGALPAVASDAESGFKNCVDNFVRTKTTTSGAGTTTHFSNSIEVGEWTTSGQHQALTPHYSSDWIETVTSGTGTFTAWGAVCSGIS